MICPCAQCLREELLQARVVELERELASRKAFGAAEVNRLCLEHADARAEEIARGLQSSRDRIAKQGHTTRVEHIEYERGILSGLDRAVGLARATTIGPLPCDHNWVGGFEDGDLRCTRRGCDARAGELAPPYSVPTFKGAPLPYEKNLERVDVPAEPEFEVERIGWAVPPKWVASMHWPSKKVFARGTGDSCEAACEKLREVLARERRSEKSKGACSE